MKKCLLTIFVAVCVLAFGFTLTASADDTATSGTCGDDLTWAFDEATGTLTISGTGDMWDFEYAKAPWITFCEKIKTVVLDDSITSIGDHAFYYCTNLQSVNLPSGITIIGRYAFCCCSKLEEIVLPEGLEEIDGSAFASCISLSEVTIPGSLKYSGSSIFSSCSGLKEVTFSEGVSYIGSYWFYHCYGLERVNIPESVCYISNHAFYGCSSLESVVVPDKASYVGAHAFYGCTELAQVYIGDGATFIGDNAFEECSSLESIEIPDSITNIGDYAFQNCTALADVTIGKSVSYIGECAFLGCESLCDVYISDLSAWCGITFYSASSNPLYHAEDLYLNGEKLLALVIPDDVTMIGYSAFYNWDNLQSLVIHDNVTSIGSYAFYNCSSLESVVIGNAVAGIDACAFQHCGRLTSLTLGEGVRRIGDMAFYANSIESIVIPENVAYIGLMAFSHTFSDMFNNTADIFFEGNAPEVYSNINQNKSFYENAVLYYIPGTTGWTDSEAYDEEAGTWNGWNLKVWETGPVLYELDENGVLVVTVRGDDYSSVYVKIRCVEPDDLGSAALAAGSIGGIGGGDGSVKVEAIQNAEGNWICRIPMCQFETGGIFSFNVYSGFVPIFETSFESELVEHSYDDIYDLICNACGYERPIPSVPMFRMYDPNSGEHFYTGSERERDFLVTNGWNYEGVAFNFPVIGEPVYRLYNPISGDHLYTMDLDERATLLAQGWNDEGVAFNSATPDCVPQYRLWNPNAVRGAWHFTGSERERDFLLGLGWQYQGIGWYSMLE